jgi:hypothetical protein
MLMIGAGLGVVSFFAMGLSFFNNTVSAGSFLSELFLHEVNENKMIVAVMKSELFFRIFILLLV